MVSEIKLNKHELEYAIEDLINRQKRYMDKINNTSACTEKECEMRLSCIKTRDIIDDILRSMQIQSFQYYRDDITTVEIR